MSIAQRSVACEGETHPLQAENNHDLSTDLTTLKWETHHAQHRAIYADALPVRARVVLAELARTVDVKNPLGDIFMSRENMSARCRIPVRTLTRALTDLEHAGLITRQRQNRYTYQEYAGCFYRANLNLTVKAARFLGLIADEVAQEAPLEDRADLQAIKADASGSIDKAFPQPQANVADGAIYKDLSPSSFQKRQPGQLPADLQRLLALGFHKFLVFRLMREAREQGKYLSDVVNATWQHLKGAHAPINYLRSLIQSPTDFSYQVRTKKEAEHRQTQIQREASTVRAAVDRCAGKVFFDNEQRRIVLSHDAQLMTLHDPREPNPRVAGGAWQAAFVKSLNAGFIRAATNHDENTFADRLNARLSKGTTPTAADIENAPAARNAAQEAQLKLKELLRGTRMSRPFARVAGC